MKPLGRSPWPSLWIWLLMMLYAGLAWSWDQPQQIKSHQQPMRSLSLPGDWVAGEWARQRGIQGAQVQRGSDGRQFVSFRADEGQWQQLQGQCDPTNPLAAQCLSDSCQSIQSLNLMGTLPEGGQGWLTPRAPDLKTILAGRPDSCPANREALPWDGSLPAGTDPACWSLQLARPCQSEETPAEYLKPHWRPNQLVVLLPSDGTNGGISVSDFADSQGLQVLEVTELKSTGDRLVRLLRPAGSSATLDGLVDLLGSVQSVLGVQKDVVYFTLDSHATATTINTTTAPGSTISEGAEGSVKAEGADAKEGVTVSTAVESISAAYGDPLELFNYGPTLTGAAQLTPRYSGAQVKLAVIDTGIDVSHPELRHAVVEQTDFSGRGYSADAHGTGVAAIIAGARGNGIGASGVAPGVEIYSFKACQPRQPGGLAAQCWSSSLIKALDEAISRDIPLINMSLGGPPSPLMERLIKAAAARGILVLAAAGNGGPNARPVYPAAWPESLAVTAVDAERQLYANANRGDYVQIAAPGVDVITAGPGNGQPMLSGTSMATAHASGIAALLLQVNPQARAADLARMLELHSHDLGIEGRDAEYGAGLVDACGTARDLADLGELSGLDELCGGGL
ncbi:MAG: S8 family serine peptidase [Motiliproteus sp.]